MNENPALPEDDVKIVKRFLQIFSIGEKALKDKYPSADAIGDEYSDPDNQEAYLYGLVEIQKNTLKQIQGLALFPDIFEEAKLDLTTNLPKPSENGWSHAGMDIVKKRQAAVLEKIIALTGFKFRIQDIPVAEDHRGNQAA